MKRLILTIAVLVLRAIYWPMKHRRLQRKVTILSRQSDHKTVDIRLLSDYLRLRYPDMECRILARKIPEGMGGKVSYMFHMIRQMNHIATSRVVVLDGYCIAACVLRHRPETRVIQMWHAIAAIKRFGYQTIDQPGGHSRLLAEALRMHRGYDYILTPGGETTRIFREAFDAPPETMLPMGLPRLDLLWDSEDSREKLRRDHDIPPDREVILYVPTFRRNRPVYLDDLVRSVDPGKFVLVIRLHPLEMPPDPAALKIPQGLQVILDHSRTTEEWIRSCDRIITDYSALGLEATLTGKPIYYYLYDISEYEKSVGLNVDPRIEMPGATAITGLQLADLLAGPYDYEALGRFRDKYITVDTDACTARLGDFIYGMVEEVHP